MKTPAIRGESYPSTDPMRNMQESPGDPAGKMCAKLIPRPSAPSDPVRLVFTAPAGPAIVVTVVQTGSRFRMILNEIDVVTPEREMPRLPVARALWVPKPNLRVAAAAWIYAGGAHHTGFSQALTTEHMEDFAQMAGVEFLPIDGDTRLREFRNELRWNEAAYLLRNGR